MDGYRIEGKGIRMGLDLSIWNVAGFGREELRAAIRKVAQASFATLYSRHDSSVDGQGGAGDPR